MLSFFSFHDGQSVPYGEERKGKERESMILSS